MCLIRRVHKIINNTDNTYHRSSEPLIDLISGTCPSNGDEHGEKGSEEKPRD